MENIIASIICQLVTLHVSPRNCEKLSRGAEIDLKKDTTKLFFVQKVKFGYESFFLTKNSNESSTFLTKNRNESSTFFNHFIKFIVKEYLLCISVFFFFFNFA
jgi:hypothetical protein